MDRNLSDSKETLNAWVALRKESVDRNWVLSNADHPHGAVALRKESVDRNSSRLPSCTVVVASLSARRAWIEISNLDSILAGVNVALRKESVDRNSLLCRILFRR